MSVLKAGATILTIILLVILVQFGCHPRLEYAKFRVGEKESKRPRLKLNENKIQISIRGIVWPPLEVIPEIAILVRVFLESRNSALTISTEDVELLFNNRKAPRTGTIVIVDHYQYTDTGQWYASQAGKSFRIADNEIFRAEYVFDLGLAGYDTSYSENMNGSFKIVWNDFVRIGDSAIVIDTIYGTLPGF